MHKIKEMLMKKIYEMEDKAERSGNATLSATDLELLHKMTDTVKNIDKIGILEEGEEYAEERGMSERRGRRYSRGGEWVARGEYGDHDGVMGGSYNDGGNSYARGQRRDNMGRYSRDGGDMVRRLEQMMGEASTEKEREALRACISKMDRD